ncbi:hypothetical protein HanIR_Chr16g0802691 [Helianthus annuus]|nr:hypothetical protein HanIR_Chr16g0802691 [Helianthus annuus]
MGYGGVGALVDTWTSRWGMVGWGLGHGLTRGLQGAPLVNCMLGRYGGAWLARVGWPRVIIFFFSVIIKIHTKFKKKTLATYSLANPANETRPWKTARPAQRPG